MFVALLTMLLATIRTRLELAAETVAALPFLRPALASSNLTRCCSGCAWVAARCRKMPHPAHLTV
jgi:hypothetical protein